MYLYLYGSVNIFDNLMKIIQTCNLKLYSIIFTMSNNQHYIIIYLYLNITVLQQNIKFM